MHMTYLYKINCPESVCLVIQELLWQFQQTKISVTKIGAWAARFHCRNRGTDGLKGDSYCFWFVSSKRLNATCCEVSSQAPLPCLIKSLFCVDLAKGFKYNNGTVNFIYSRATASISAKISICLRISRNSSLNNFLMYTLLNYSTYYNIRS